MAPSSLSRWEVESRCEEGGPHGPPGRRTRCPCARETRERLEQPARRRAPPACMDNGTRLGGSNPRRSQRGEALRKWTLRRPSGAIPGRRHGRTRQPMATPPRWHPPPPPSLYAGTWRSWLPASRQLPWRCRSRSGPDTRPRAGARRRGACVKRTPNREGRGIHAPAHSATGVAIWFIEFRPSPKMGGRRGDLSLPSEQPRNPSRPSSRPGRSVHSTPRDPACC